MKGFVISWFYPPVNSSEGLVTYKLLKASGIKHDVFTQKDNDNWSYNTTEKKLTSPNVKTIFAESSESFEDWANECVEYFKKHRKEYDFIMSRSMPPESHVAALKIKELFPDIKWIASFGDPIYNSPFNLVSRSLPPHKVNSENFADVSIRYAFSPKRIAKDMIWQRSYRRDMAAEGKLRSIEQDSMDLSDLVIYNNPYQKEYMESTLSNGRSVHSSVVIPHTFDPDLYPSKSSRKSSVEKIKITYLGHLDYIRTPINFLRAVSRLKTTRPLLYKNLEVDFYGNLDNISKVAILDEEIFDQVRVRKPVTYEESLGIMQSSDWCLLVDANLTQTIQENIYYAAKLADYIGAGSNIFAVSMLQGASADIVREIGGVLSSHSVDEIYMWLVLILNKQVSGKPVRVDRFKSISAANIYDDAVKALVSEKE